MATLRATILATLEADGTLTGYLTGGIFDASDFDDQEGISMNNAPKQADGVQLKPFAVMRWGSAPTFGPQQIGAERETLEIHIYQDIGYATIELARRRIKTLLHDTYVTVSDRSLVHLLNVFTSGEIPAQELAYAPRRFVRYEVINC